MFLIGCALAVAALLVVAALATWVALGATVLSTLIERPQRRK